MNLILATGGLSSSPTHLFGDALQLTHEVKPLTNAHVVEKLLLHAFTKGIARHLIPRILDVIPEFEHG